MEQEKRGARGRSKQGPHPAALSRLWKEPGFYSVNRGKVLVAFKLGCDMICALKKKMSGCRGKVSVELREQIHTTNWVGWWRPLTHMVLFH